MRRLKFIFFFIVCWCSITHSQLSYFRNYDFTERDSLRGELSLIRECFDVKHYDLTVEFDIENKSIVGSNQITFQLLKSSDIIQIDLNENLNIESIFYGKESLNYTRKYDAIFVELPELQLKNIYTIEVNYAGIPKAALNPPWDGGFIWRKDMKGKPWVHVSCQGIGASLWWPNKDHLSDEPDSMKINLIVPENLMAISNGELTDIVDKSNSKEYKWTVKYPINNYNVSFSIGNYEHFSTTYESQKKGKLACDYYVLPQNLQKAKKHFKQVNKVLEAFEYYLGPYPFWDDGYALIETPYLGMEHQSAIAYGNKYQKGYMGGLIPANMDWDYIIVHETAHEYWGNAVSVNDYAEIWIHEAFATYMEALFVEYHYGKKEADQYLQTQRNHKNHYPIIGPKNVNFHDFKDQDHYYKGAWVLHTLRSSINNDHSFFKIIRQFYEAHEYKNADSEDFFNLVNEITGKDYTSFFNQYLSHPYIPILEYATISKGKNVILKYKWNTSIENFRMPIFLNLHGEKKWISPSNEWQSLTLKNVSESEFSIPFANFLIDGLKLKGS